MRQVSRVAAAPALAEAQLGKPAAGGNAGGQAGVVLGAHAKELDGPQQRPLWQPGQLVACKHSQSERTAVIRSITVC